jgi:soluble lytic murein transglycosylase-like protein
MLVLAGTIFASLNAVHAQSAGKGLSPRAHQCIAEAATYHRVNGAILEAIARHESGGSPSAVAKNTNGSVDVGLMQINSIHFADLSLKGVAPDHLLDECVAVFVGAWKLSKKMARHGNTWWAVGAYHSETPQYNVRYQNRIFAQLKSMGVPLPSRP